MKTILFQGDSITDAERFRENDAHTGIGYPTLVKAELSFDFPGQYVWYNRGISGNRIVDLYARIKADIINLKPDFISILIGVNDVWHELDAGNGVGADKFLKVYSMLIEEIKAALPCAQIMILEPFVLKASATERCWDEFQTEVGKRAEAAKEIAQTYHLTFIPLQDEFNKAARLISADYWLVDGVHPTAAGHELIKREWISAFKKLEQ